MVNEHRRTFALVRFEHTTGTFAVENESESDEWSDDIGAWDGFLDDHNANGPLWSWSVMYREDFERLEAEGRATDSQADAELEPNDEPAPHRGVSWALLVLALFLGPLIVGAAFAGCQSARYPISLAPAAQGATTVDVASICDGRGSLGSGVLVAPRLAVTAHHVAPCDVVQVNGEPAEVFEADAEADIAVLYLSEPLDGEVAPLGPPPDVDDRVCVEPAIPNQWRSCGWVTAREGELFGFSAPVWRGNSGSGVWDSRGRLVGIATEKLDGPIPGGFGVALAPHRELFGGAL